MLRFNLKQLILLVLFILAYNSSKSGTYYIYENLNSLSDECLAVTNIDQCVKICWLAFFQTCKSFAIVHGRCCYNEFRISRSQVVLYKEDGAKMYDLKGKANNLL